MNATKLYRSRANVVIGGVCAGLGQYLNVDPVLVRLIFVVLALANGVGVLIYVVLWFITPLEGQDSVAIQTTAQTGADEIAERARAMGEDLRRAVESPNPQAGVIIGAILVGLGVLFLLQNIGIAWLWWLDLDVLWPLLLVAVGVALLLRRPGR